MKPKRITAGLYSYRGFRLNRESSGWALYNPSFKVRGYATSKEQWGFRTLAAAALAVDGQIDRWPVADREWQIEQEKTDDR